jgi:hypothetical protein
MTTFRNVRSLEEAFAYATEVNLATLEELLMVKKSSKSKVRRQRGICLGMLEICASSLVTGGKIDWGHEFHPNFPRVSKILSATESGSCEERLDRFTRGWSEPASPPNAVAATPS